MTPNADKTNQTGTSSEEVRPDGGPHRLFGLKEDDWVIVGILIFCAVTFGITLTFEDVPPMIAQGLPPDRFPQVLIAIIALLAIYLVFENRKKGTKARKIVPPMVYYSSILMVAFVALFTWLDILIAMPLLVIALSVVWGERRYGWLGLYAVLYSAAVFLLFYEVMEVVFPNGPINLLFK